MSSHVPFFSLEFPEDWVSDSGYELYETWLKNANNISLDLGSNDRVGIATLGEIKKYRDVVSLCLLILDLVTNEAVSR